jgi:anti-sigma factor RsiW
MAHDDCERWLDDLSAYVDREASTSACEAIEQHMRECGDCRVVVDTLRRMILLYQTLPDPAIPSGARRRLYRALSLEAFPPVPR